MNFIECVCTVRNTAILQYILVLDQAANISSYLKCIICTNKVSSLAEESACVCAWLYHIATYILLYCDFCSLFTDLPVISHAPPKHTHTQTHLCVLIFGGWITFGKWLQVKSFSCDEDVVADAEKLCVLPLRNELRKIIDELHSSHVGFVIHCISIMPSCDNNGLIANSQYFTSNLFYKLLLYFYKYRQSISHKHIYK